MEPNDIPEEVVKSYMEAWEAKRKAIGRGIAPPDAKVRAGLSAAFKALYILHEID